MASTRRLLCSGSSYFDAFETPFGRSEISATDFAKFIVFRLVDIPFGMGSELFDDGVVFYDSLKYIPNQWSRLKCSTCRSANCRVGFPIPYRILDWFSNGSIELLTDDFDIMKEACRKFVFDCRINLVEQDRKRWLAWKSIILLKVFECTSAQVSTRRAETLAWRSGRISLSYSHSLSVKSLSMLDWPSDCAAAFAFTIFSSNSISDTIRCVVVEDPDWSTFVVQWVSLVSSTVRVVWNEDGFDKHRGRSGLAVVATTAGSWRVDQKVQDVFNRNVIRCTTVSFQYAFWSSRPVWDH